MSGWPFWVGVAMGVWLALSVAVGFAAAQFLKARDVEAETRTEHVSARDVDALGQWELVGPKG